ncbi:MAG: ATP-binding protein [Desulfovibrionales bacterium]
MPEKMTDKRTMESRLQRLNLLNEITRAIALRQDLESIFHIALKRIEENLPVDFCSIWMCDPPCEDMTVVSCGPASAVLAQHIQVEKGNVIPLAETALSRCMTGESTYVPMLGAGSDRLLEKFRTCGLRSLHAEPLHAAERVLGVMVCGRKEHNGFSSEDREFLQQLGKNLVLAFEQWKLIRELQHANMELKQTQRHMARQERLRALGQMASGIVHDINNALSPIVGYSDMLVEGDLVSEPKARTYLGHIQTAARDITLMIQRMRNFYRPRDDEEELEPLEIVTIIEQAIELARPRWKDLQQINGRYIRVHKAFQPDIPPVWGVESELREALVNVFFNAVDAMPEGGELRVGAVSTLFHVAVEVSDSGEGMDEQTRERCLEPFFTTKGEGGTGLGLAMVYGMVKRHRGDLEILSSPKEGTTVRLLFPRLVRQQRPRTEKTLCGPIPAASILCIDDDSEITRLMAEMLTEDGHRVETKASGKLGIERFLEAEENSPFDVIITDLGMPHMSGRDVLHLVKAQNPDKPVILMSGWSDTLHPDDQIVQRADHVLGKPPTLKTLREALGSVLL